MDTSSSFYVGTNFGASFCAQISSFHKDICLTGSDQPKQPLWILVTVFSTETVPDIAALVEKRFILAQGFREISFHLGREGTASGAAQSIPMKPCGGG